MSVVEELILEIKEIGAGVAGASVSRLGRQIDETGRKATRSSKSHAGLGSALGGVKGLAGTAATAIGAGGLGAALADSIKNAEALQAAQASLRTSIHHNVRNPAADATKHMTDFAESLSVTGGFEATENVGALTQLITATGSQAKAERDLGLATDISRQKHKSLNTVVRALANVEQGRTTGLGRMGVQIPKVTTAMDALRAAHGAATPAMIKQAKAADMAATRQAALTALQQKFGGQSAAYSRTAAGAMENFRHATEVLSTKLGTLLLPILTKVFTWMAKFVGQMISGKGAGGAFVTVLKSFAAVIKVVVGVAAFLWKWTTPIGLIITHFKWLKNVVIDVAKWIINAFKNTKRWIVQAWGNLGGILAAPFRWVWNSVIRPVAGWIAGAWKALPGVLRSVGRNLLNVLAWPWYFLRDHVVKPVISFFVTAFDVLKDAIQPVLDAINTAASAVSSLNPFSGGDTGPLHPGAHPGRFGHPGRQHGGPIHHSARYWVGERGPELVSLPQGSHVRPAHETPSGDDRPIVIYNVLDGKILSKSVVRQGRLQLSRT